MMRWPWRHIGHDWLGRSVAPGAYPANDMRTREERIMATMRADATPAAIAFCEEWIVKKTLPKDSLCILSLDLTDGNVDTFGDLLRPGVRGMQERGMAINPYVWIDPWEDR